jgi:hypothetical protein
MRPRVGMAESKKQEYNKFKCKGRYKMLSFILESFILILLIIFIPIVLVVAVQELLVSTSAPDSGQAQPELKEDRIWE